MTTLISPVEDIVADMRAGRMVILVDEEDRENDGVSEVDLEAAVGEIGCIVGQSGQGIVRPEVIPLGERDESRPPDEPIHEHAHGEDRRGDEAE